MLPCMDEKLDSDLMDINLYADDLILFPKISDLRELTAKISPLCNIRHLQKIWIFWKRGKTLLLSCSNKIQISWELDEN